MKKAKMPSFSMSDNAALRLGTDVIKALTENVHIPSPQPTLVELQAAWDAYNTSLGDAKYGSREQRAQKNADKAALITLLRDECNYVNALAKGDEIILASCGFPLTKERQPKVLGTPEVKVEQGDTGELILSTPAVDGAVSYAHQYKPQDSASWSEIRQSAATCKIPNLQPGTHYDCRIIAIGTKSQVSTSDVVTKMAA